MRFLYTGIACIQKAPDRRSEDMASPGVLPRFEFNATYVHSLRQGDPTTEEHFVSHFSPILLRKLRRKLRSAELADDLRQETFLRVLTLLRSERGVRNPERFEILVLAVCNNVLLETYREQKKIVQMEPEFDLPSSAPSPAARLMADETGEHVRKLLSRMKPEVRAILQAAFLEEQDRDEICKRFGVSRNYLRLVLYRAKKMFGACAQKDVTAKTELKLRRSRRAGDGMVMAPELQPAALSRGTTCATSAFLPSQRGADATGVQCWT
jgi:RNA polymerase sigma-70 factor (ECF subfamily)